MVHMMRNEHESMLFSKGGREIETYFTLLIFFEKASYCITDYVISLISLYLGLTFDNNKTSFR